MNKLFEAVAYAYIGGWHYLIDTSCSETPLPDLIGRQVLVDVEGDAETVLQGTIEKREGRYSINGVALSKKSKVWGEILERLGCD